MNKKERPIVYGLILILAGLVYLVTGEDRVHGFAVLQFTAASIIVLGICILIYGVIFGVVKEKKEVEKKNLICPKCQNFETIVNGQKSICKSCNIPLIWLDEFLEIQKNKRSDAEKWEDEGRL